MIRRDDATQAQVDAADPVAATWLSANAGSGKTRVLTDRVARLLLRGTPPERILCLTYTKAAASEMQNRLFQRLGGWAMRADNDLRKELAELGEDSALGVEDLDRARTLFARAIETPGGLKIQTIHSFCATLLRRFPLEAGVSPQFHEMEDRAAALLRADVVEQMATGPHAALVADLAFGLSDEGFDKITAQILSRRAPLSLPATDDDIRGWFDVPQGSSTNQITAAALRAGDMSLLKAVIAVLNNSGSNDQKAAAKLSGILSLEPGVLPILEAVFLFGKDTKAPFGAKVGALPAKKAREAMDSTTLDQLNDWMEAVEEARRLRIAAAAADRTIALYRFAEVFLPAYDATKAQRGALDFDDLIDRARALLTDPRVAEWVLYRLDGGIDHILVDEAQDTSPRQWEVIDRLALEITSGIGAGAERPRTLFVVGDKKQSIYSFQGADPGAFDEMRDDFGARLALGQTPLERRTLEFSFRSAPVILDLVDETFRGKEPSGFGADGRHKAFHAAMPGRVDLWPLVPNPDKQADPPFEDPVDTLRDDDAQSVLANRIAKEIKRMIAVQTPVAEFDRETKTWHARAMTPGDVLILVQSRTGVFEPIIRALKAEGVPTAGTDRLKVGAELAVRDLRALLSVLATPEDDLSLATVLKSPLFGWDEQTLYSLAQPRGGQFLWQTLRDSAHVNDTAVLLDLMGQTDFLRPYDLIERILTRHNGRRLLLGRLGPEAEDGINALLSQALAYEQGEIPSLTGFLAWMESDSLEIKRQISQTDDQVRIMSVHGAKGLEAPIVILPDTTPKKADIKDQILAHNDRALWKTKSDESPPLINDALDVAKTRQDEERDRLLYVAMTRAEQRLIVCAAGDLGKQGAGWYDAIQRGMDARGAVETVYDYADGHSEPGLVLRGTDWPAITRSAAVPPAPAPSLPDWTQTAAPDVVPALELITPSNLGGAKALPGEAGMDTDSAMQFGSLVHLLLEHLPALASDDQSAAADSLATDADRAMLPAAMAHVTACLNAPDLAALFAPDALVEVPITAALPDLDGRQMLGIIDRLIVSPDHVLAVDFKSNAVQPGSADAVPEGLLRQMGAYAAALAQVFPDKRIETALVWTATGTFMPLPHNIVTTALTRAVHLDDTPTHP